jgi:hypothetical protein
LVGGSIFYLMLLNAGMKSTFGSPIFDAPNLFFIIFNSLLESLRSR